MNLSNELVEHSSFQNELKTVFSILLNTIPFSLVGKNIEIWGMDVRRNSHFKQSKVALRNVEFALQNVSVGPPRIKIRTKGTNIRTEGTNIRTEEPIFALKNQQSH